MPASLLSRLLGQLGGLLGEQVRGWGSYLRERLRHTWTSRPPASRQGAILLCALLALVGPAGLLAQAQLSARLPSLVDWKAAAALLAREGRTGDAVVVAPAWLERARELAPHALPVVTPAHLEGEPFPGVRRLWLVGGRGAPGGSAAALRVLTRQASATDARQLGGLEVVRVDLGAPLLPLAVLADRAPAGAAVTARDLGGLAHRCIRLDVTPEAPAALRFRSLPMGRTLAGQAFLEGAAGPPVRLTIRVGDAAVGTADLAGTGWRTFSIDTAAADPGPQEVVLEAEAAGGARTLCLEALSLP
jgi:hypothetical protein